MKFRFKGAQFRQENGGPSTRGVSTEDEFVIVKTNEMMRFYDRLSQFGPKTIMEIGMYEGGSLVWLDKLFEPETIIGIDARKEPIHALERYRESHPHVHTYYGRYQEKPGTLMAAREHFKTGIDLVVEDASHHYEKSKATFMMIFPLVRAGGHYVIEDWEWAHTPAAQAPDSAWAHRPALTNLIFELTLLAGTSSIIQELTVLRGLVAIRKGSGVFRPEMMDFSDRLRGRELPCI